MLLEDDVDSRSDLIAQVDVSLSWDRITVYADRKREFFAKNIVKEFFGYSEVDGEPNKILDSVTGRADSGNLVAIMGPSGAGKTTLLAALARRIEVASGHIRINGETVSRNSMSHIAGYLPQFEALPEALTAMEYMIFACALRLDKRTSSKERKILAINIFAELGLLESSDTCISRLSGGEIKRLSLAVEMVTKPRILFLDEPTSGLDTWTAMRVIECVQTQANNGTLIFCSIHQPAMEVYKMFSHVIIMANGRTAYHGTLAGATDFFNSQGFQCPESFNEAEYYVRILSNADSSDFLNATTNSYLVSGCSAQICDSFSTYRKTSSASAPKNRHGLIAIKSQIRKPNSFVKFYWVVWRILLEIRRTMFKNAIHHGTFLASAFVVGLFYIGVDSRTQTGVQDARGALYLTTSEIIFTTAYSVINVMPGQMPLYLRENGMYGPAVYYTATILGLVPEAVFHSLTFFVMMFVALNETLDLATVLKFATCFAASTIASSAYGVMISSCIENPNVATNIMVPYDLISYMMSGQFYNIRTMPPYISWLKYLSIFYYTNEALAIIHWTKIDNIECYTDEDLPCFRNGREVLAGYGYDESNLWTNIFGLLAMGAVMHVCGYLGVRRRRAVKQMY